MLVAFLLFCFLIPFSVLDAHFFNSENENRFLPYSNSKWILNQGIEWHYQEWNPTSSHSNPVLVFVHGFGGSSFSWRYTGPYFANLGYRVIAVDLPGFGYSSRAVNALTKINTPSGLQAIIDSIVQNKKVCWIGHSMGTQVLGNMASLTTDTLQMIFVDGLQQSNSQQTKVSSVLLWLVQKMLPINTLANTITSQDRIAKFLAGAYGKLPDSQAIEGYWLPFKEVNAGRAFLAIMTNRVFQPKYMPQMGNTKIIWGENDTWIPLKLAKEFSETKSLPLHIVSSAAHCPMETHSDIFNELLEKIILEGAR